MRTGKTALFLLAGITIGAVIYLCRQPAPPPATTTATPVATRPPPVQAPAMTAAIQSPTQPVEEKPVPSTPSEKIKQDLNLILTDDNMTNDEACLALAKLVEKTDASLEDRREILGHLINLSSGKESKYLLPLLQNPKLPEELTLHILSDALNSPLAWQADASLTILAHQQGQLPRTEAHDHLVFLTDEDHGYDLTAWTKAVAKVRDTWPAVKNDEP